MATLTMGCAANDIAVNAGQATVLDNVADFNTRRSKPPIPYHRRKQLHIHLIFLKGFGIKKDD